MSYPSVSATNPIRTAVILAAGRGSRLDPELSTATSTTDAETARGYSKPLLKLGAQTLLQRTVGACRDAGVTRIIVVTGFHGDLVAENVRSYNRGDIEIVHNAKWKQPNGLSLYACASQLDEPFLLMMADHLFDVSMLTDLARHPLADGTVTLAVDKKIAAVFDLDDATKARLDGNAIVELGKTLPNYDAIDCGLFACTTAIFTALETAMDHLSGAHGQTPANAEARLGCSLSAGMTILAKQKKMLAYDIGDRQWQDVDTPSMLKQAETMIATLGERP